MVQFHVDAANVAVDSGNTERQIKVLERKFEWNRNFSRTFIDASEMKGQIAFLDREFNLIRSHRHKSTFEEQTSGVFSIFLGDNNRQHIKILGGNDKANEQAEAQSRERELRAESESWEQRARADGVRIRGWFCGKTGTLNF